MKSLIPVYHTKELPIHIDRKKIHLKRCVFLFLLGCSLCTTIAQTNVKSGNIRDCNVWNFPQSGTTLNNAKIINGTTVQSNTTVTDVSSIQLETTSTIKMSAGDKITVTPGGATDAKACPATVSNYLPRASNDYDNWLFNSSGYIYQRIGQYINYIAGTDATTNAPGEYAIRGLIFVGSTVQNAGLASGVREVGYIRKKTVQINLSTGGYVGSGAEKIIATLTFNFSTARTDYVDGNWKYTTTICDFDATNYLSTSTCLLALRNPNATLAPFLLGDVDFGFKCYNNMNRITESGLLAFEYIPSTLPTFAAGEKIFLTIKSIHDPDLAYQAISARFLNVSAELYLRAQKQF